MAITSEAFNDRVRAAMRHTPLRGITQRAGGTIRHKWKVSVHRRTAREWAVGVGDGCVNDTPAVIGTVPLWQHPSLTATAPDESTKNLGHFAHVGAGQRPSFFRSRALWEFDLYRTSIVVSGVRPFTASALLEGLPVLPPATTLVGLLAEMTFREVLASIGLAERDALQALRPPYKVRVANVPALLDGTETHRLAWLYLARRPGAAPAQDLLFVQQVAFWNFQAVSALEDQGLGATLPVLQATGDVGSLTALSIFEMLLDSTRVEWWNV